MVYAIFTAGQRTWGGPRADAGKADHHTTPGQAVEQAEKTGDELNVVPETFKPAMEAAVPKLPHHTVLLPSARLEGRFAPAEELPGGWYRQGNDSGVLRADMTARGMEEGRWRKGFRRDSTESSLSGMSTNESVHVPRRVESIFAPEDALAYLDRQAQQRPAGGAYLEQQTLHMAQLAHNEAGGLNRSGSDTSLSSLASDDSVPMHFGLRHHLPTIPKDVHPTLTALPIVHLPTRRRRNSFDNPTHRLDERTLQIPTGSAGKSPLARKSFTRLASPPPQHQVDGAEGEVPMMPMNAAEVIELERIAARRASEEEQRRGRRRPSEDAQGRRRGSREVQGRRPRKLSKRSGSGRGSRGSSKGQRKGFGAAST